MRGGWNLSDHARQRMREMGLNRVRVGRALNDPEVDYASRRRRVAQADDIAVVYEPISRVVVTVLWRAQEPWVRPTPLPPAA